MLILSRKKEESLVIQDNIIITILEIGNDKVKLGISAPREITILRQELCDREKKLESEEESQPEAS